MAKVGIISDNCSNDETIQIVGEYATRGVYALKDLKAGHVLTPDDYYLAIPLQKGQLSCRELLNNLTLAKDCSKDVPLMVDSIDSPYNRDEALRTMIYKRGL